MTVSTSKEAFLIQYESIHTPFMKYCKGRALGCMDTEDLMQETILRTLIQWESIQDQQRLLYYMIGVANNIVRNHFRQYPGTKLDIDDFKERLQGHSSDPQIILDIQLMYEAIYRLKSQDQEILLLYEVTGYSIKEIAELMQISPSNVKVRLHRTRKKLRHAFQEEHLTDQQLVALISTVLLFFTSI